MPIIAEIVGFDEMFAKLRQPPIVINEISNTTEQEKQDIGELISTRCSPDMLSMLPTCSCGETKGEYAVDTLCPECGTPVRSSINEDIEPLLWFKRPDGVEKLINPHIWNMLRLRLKKSGYDVLQWLCDSTYRASVKQPDVVNVITAAGIQRGYNYFVKNFDFIIDTLFQLKDFRPRFTRNGSNRDYLYELIQRDRDRIFSDFIPLPNKALLIIEKTNVGIYIDPTVLGAIDAIQTIVSIDSPMNDFSPRVKENRTIKALSKLAQFYDSYDKANSAGKTGIYRKHKYATRTHFSFRAVVTSLTGVHRYEEIHVPWGIGVTAFRPHLISKLLRMGYEYNKAVGFLYGHVEKYHPLLDQLLQELIHESQRLYLGIPVLMQRNPSLLPGSAQRVFITKFKTDPSDHTTSLSIIVVKQMNCDFDGRHYCCH